MLLGHSPEAERQAHILKSWLRAQSTHDGYFHERGLACLAHRFLGAVPALSSLEVVSG